MAGKLNPPLKIEFKKSKSSVFNTKDKQLMAVLEKNKRQRPTENETKLMEWNEAIYNQEKMESTQTLKDELEPIPVPKVALISKF